MNNAPTEDGVYIYALCEPDPPHEVRYVGQTRNHPRWRYYMHLSGHKTQGKGAWLASLRAAGRHAVIRVLDVVLPEHADEREQFHIADQAERGARLLNILHNPGATTDSNHLTRQLSIRVTEDEYALIMELADLAERQPTDVARRAFRRGLPTEERIARAQAEVAGTDSDEGGDD